MNKTSVYNRDIRVLPWDKPTMFIFLNTIFVTNNYLVSTSDECLKSCLWHEYGHLRQRKTILSIILISMVIFIQLMIIIPFRYMIILSIAYYIWCCYLCRLGEYKSDEYSLHNTTRDGMIEMLKGEGCYLDRGLWLLFYPFRYHPTVKKRIKNLEKI